MDETPERRPMDVPLIAGIAAGGALIGLLSSLGSLPGSLEWVAWLVLAAAGLIATLRRIPEDAFRHLVFAFMLGGFLGADVKILLWERFLANHQELVNATLTEGIEQVPRVSVIIADTATGALIGLVTGMVAVYLRKRGMTRN